MNESVEYFFFNLINSIARRLSFSASRRIGIWLGDAVFTLTRFRKRVTLENLRHAFPEKDEAELRAIARGAYRNYGIALLESLWAGGQDEETLRRVVAVVNREVLTEALRRRKGVLLLSAHYGSWELLASAVRLQLGMPMGMIVQRQRNKRIDEVFEKNRTRFQNFTIPMGPSSRRVLKALADNQVVIVLGDQSGPKEAVFVDFFGRPAATHRGVAAFSLKTGAPILMGFLVRQPDGTYSFTLEDIDQSDLGVSEEEKIVELTRRHVAVLERWIRRHPDHWLWMHKRWKHTAYFESKQLVEEKS